LVDLLAAPTTAGGRHRRPGGGWLPATVWPQLSEVRPQLAAHHNRTQSQQSAPGLCP